MVRQESPKETPVHRRPPAAPFAALLACLALLVSCADDDATAPPAPTSPEILGQDVSGVDHRSATLGGWVDGHGRPTVCWFDYGNDITYGARTPDLDAGAVAGAVRVEHVLTGLDPARMHWWRLVAVAGDDTATAADTTFITLPPPNQPPATQAIHAPLGGTAFHFYWTGPALNRNVLCLQMFSRFVG